MRIDRCEGYWDIVSRIDDDVRPLLRYIFENPLRARLASSARDYPFLGSDVWDLRDIL